MAKTLRLDDGVVADLQKLAALDRRSENNMIEILILDEVRRRGWDPTTPEQLEEEADNAPI